MKKPREKVIMDTWHDPDYGHAFIRTKAINGSFGPCLVLNFQGDIETKDVQLNSKDAERLIDALKTQLSYLKWKSKKLKSSKKK